jgi:hypothetical protein
MSKLKTIFDVGPDEWRSPNEVLREVLNGDALARTVLLDALGADGLMAHARRDTGGAKIDGWSDALEQQESERLARVVLARDHKALGELVMGQVLAYIEDVTHTIPRREEIGGECDPDEPWRRVRCGV